MGNNITDRLKYKESVVKFSKKYGVAKAAYKFGECKRTIYRWRNRYDGTLESLKDKSRRPHSHPNQHTEEEIKLIKNYKRNNKEKRARNIENLAKKLAREAYKTKTEITMDI